MTVGKAVFVGATVLLAGCSTTPLTACGPALPPIATASHEPPPPGFAPPSFAAGADAPAAAPAPKTAAAIRAENPLNNMAAIAGR